MGESSRNTESNEFKLVRCMDWLQKQNHPKKLAQQNKNDIQFIIETNAHRKKFLLSAAEDDGTVPGGVDETNLQPKVVPLARLRVENLCMECEWQSCREYFVNYDKFQEHVATHTSQVRTSAQEESVSYDCLWDVCGFQTSDFTEMARHINYHAYHARLLAIGFNGRATLKLDSCRKDSSKRNQLPPMKAQHTCLWFECTLKFNSYQKFLDHVKAHVFYSENFLCSWAGCGFKCHRRALLTMHVRSHTGEKVIACYHCGSHFSSNHKLSMHLARQNLPSECGYQCPMCSKWYATDYLFREHSRQHVSYYACSLCDMSAPTRAAIAIHMRYRHLPSDAVRCHACPHCPYKAVLKSDLEKHLKIHDSKRKKRRRSNDSENLLSDDEQPVKGEKRRYACHMCTGKPAMFSRGYKLTTHLAKVHGAQWPFGHSRFRYQISDDGLYRLTTTRIEDLEVSKKIMDGYSESKESLKKKNKFDFDLKKTSLATRDTPTRFEITLKDSTTENDTKLRPIKVETVLASDNKAKKTKRDVKKEIKEENKIEIDIKENVTEYDIKEENELMLENMVEICMYDLDEAGNIISSETIVQGNNECV